MPKNNDKPILIKNEDLGILYAETGKTSVYVFIALQSSNGKRNPFALSVIASDLFLAKTMVEAKHDCTVIDIIRLADCIQDMINDYIAGS